MKTRAQVRVKCSSCGEKSYAPQMVPMFVCNLCLASRGATDPYQILGYWHGCLHTPNRAINEDRYWEGYGRALRGAGLAATMPVAQRNAALIRRFPGMDPDVAHAAFVSQRNNAQTRGIDWAFDLESWCCVWHESGKWAERGRNKGQYVMARFGDVGPYSPDNVRITTVEENSREGQVTRRRGDFLEAA